MNTDRIRILLADDDEDDYFLTKDLLSNVEGISFELQWASSYKTARLMIGSNSHDVFLFDYRLGEHTGIDLLREVISEGFKVPVIILTGQGDQGIDTEALQAGASDYLSKAGLNTDTLMRAIRYAIERKRTEERIIYMAYYDGLTDLPNRTLFMDRLKQAIAHSNRYKDICALMFLDLDNFKRINDTLDHRTGDLLLRGVAERLYGFVRSADTIARGQINPLANTVARLGGDEFTILLTEIHSMQDVAKIAQRILNIIAQPFQLEGHEVFVTSSIGIAMYPTDGEDIDILIRNADTAMYHAKANGKNHFKFYKHSMNASALERLSMEGDLRKAVSNEEMVLHYQPRIDIHTGCILGTEALVRWHHPEKGLISPAQFIPLAEETGLIIPIGEWVLKTACAQNRQWQNTGPICGPVGVSLNLSGIQFRQENLIKIIEKVLGDSGLAPSFLELEITESVIMTNPDETVALLHKLKDMGVSLSMDDFGTGYSSFSYLKRFPLDNIKIDRSFIRDITTSDKDAAIIKAIIAMAHVLDLRVIAEGVETDEQLKMLQDLGCDEMQGFLLSRPLPAEHVYEFLELWENMLQKLEAS